MSPPATIISTYHLRLRSSKVREAQGILTVGTAGPEPIQRQTMGRLLGTLWLQLQWGLNWVYWKWALQSSRTAASYWGGISTASGMGGSNRWPCKEDIMMGLVPPNEDALLPAWISSGEHIWHLSSRPLSYGNWSLPGPGRYYRHRWSGRLEEES